MSLIFSPFHKTKHLISTNRNNKTINIRLLLTQNILDTSATSTFIAQFLFKINYNKNVHFYKILICYVAMLENLKFKI